MGKKIISGIYKSNPQSPVGRRKVRLADSKPDPYRRLRWDVRIERYAEAMRERPTSLEVALQRRLKRALPADLLAELQAQYVLDYHIIDFALPSLRLALEADGPTHETVKGRRKDLRRDRELNRAGWLVVHFSADELTARDETTVVARILAAISCQKNKK